MSSQPPQKNNIWYATGLGMELGFLIAIPLVVCVGVGMFIDRKSGTFPAALIISIFLGIILTVADVYYIVLPFLEKRSSNNKDNKK